MMLAYALLLCFFFFYNLLLWIFFFGRDARENRQLIFCLRYVQCFCISRIKHFHIHKRRSASNKIEYEIFSKKRLSKKD